MKNNDRSGFLLTKGEPELEKLVRETLDDALKTVKRNTKRFNGNNNYPVQVYKNGVYDETDGARDCWTQGFWPGQLWLAYEMTGDEYYREIAEKYVGHMFDRAYNNYMLDFHHDIGFLYTPSCVSAYKLTGNETALRAAKIAAWSLSRRFRQKGEFIQSIGNEFDENSYKFIADTMLNLPLLFWATEETGEPMYAERALKHLNTTMKYMVREDGSSFHHFRMDRATGEPVKGFTWQGYSDDSCWTRGHSWIVYGLAIAYGYTKDPEIFKNFCRVTDFFLNNMPLDPEDLVPYWDFHFREGDVERDASAGIIVCCGIMEMAQFVSPEDEKLKGYIEKAKKMLKNIIERCHVRSERGEEGILEHITDALPQGVGEVCEPYGDYFFIEALIRAITPWKSYW